MSFDKLRTNGGSIKYLARSRGNTTTLLRIGIIFFEATSVKELKKEFKFSIDDYLVCCAEMGRPTGQAFHGRHIAERKPGSAQGGGGGQRAG